MPDLASPTQISEIASKDTNRIVGSIAKCLAANSPYINVYRGGTFPAGVSDEVRSVVQMQAAPGDSLAEPTFVNDTDLCGQGATQDLTDVTEFTYRLQGFRGFGPKVCVKKGYAAFKDSYLRSEDALSKLITQYINADIRAVTTRLSGSKFVAITGNGLFANFSGGDEADIGIQFGAVLPDAAPSFKSMHALARFLKEALFGEMFAAGDKVQPHFRIIAESDVIEQWRNETGVKDSLVALTTGGFKLGETSLSSYSFETSPAYRGLAFATDQRNQRASGFKVNGDLDLINPVVLVPNAGKNTSSAKVNPAWLTAPYGVLHIFADGAFERQVPERYVGEGSFKFAPQLYMGELDWHYQLDNSTNIYGDFGWHKYQITRAYRPLRPQHVVSVLYKRCATDLGLATCTAETALAASASL